MCSAVAQLHLCRSLNEAAVLINLVSYVSSDSAANSKDATSVDIKISNVIVAFAIDLRKLLDKAIPEMPTQLTVRWYKNSGTKVTRGRPKRSKENNRGTTLIAQYVFEAVDSMSVNRLPSPPSKPKEVLNQLILKLTEQVYASKQSTVTATSATTPGNSKDTGTHEKAIKPLKRIKARRCLRCDRRDARWHVTADQKLLNWGDRWGRGRSQGQSSFYVSILG